MKVILHIGAHFCGARGIQSYLASNRDGLAQQGLYVLGPERLRGGLLHGLHLRRACVTTGPAGQTARLRQGAGACHVPLSRAQAQSNPQMRVRGRLALLIEQAQQEGAKALLLSDPHLMGLPRDCLGAARLYPSAGERIARLVHAMEGRVSDVMLSIRNPQDYWAALLAGRVRAQGRLPHPALLRRIGASPRSWRDVITDLHCAMPSVRLHVFAHEAFAPRPDLQLAHVLAHALVAPPPAPDAGSAYGGLPARDALAGPAFVCPPVGARHQLLEFDAPPQVETLRPALRGDLSLDGQAGRWKPFSQGQYAALGEAYDDDLMWLVGGAEGMAELVRDPGHGHGDERIPDKQAARKIRPRYDDLTRGPNHDPDDGRLAGTR